VLFFLLHLQEPQAKRSETVQNSFLIPRLSSLKPIT